MILSVSAATHQPARMCTWLAEWLAGSLAVAQRRGRLRGGAGHPGRRPGAAPAEGHRAVSERATGCRGQVGGARLVQHDRLRDCDSRQSPCATG
jgi:hypothetical protein